MTRRLTACTHPDHDHYDRDPDVGIPEAELRAANLENREVCIPPMRCHDCDAPTHYDYGVEAYVHDAPDAPGCFLIQSRPKGASDCTEATR